MKKDYCIVALFWTVLSALVGLLAACGEDGATISETPTIAAQATKVTPTQAEVLDLDNDRFLAVLSFCDTHGHRVFVGQDDQYASSPVFALDDPSCQR